MNKLKDHIAMMELETELMSNEIIDADFDAKTSAAHLKIVEPLFAIAMNELRRANFEFYCRYGYFYGGN